MNSISEIIQYEKIIYMPLKKQKHIHYSQEYELGIFTRHRGRTLKENNMKWSHNNVQSSLNNQNRSLSLAPILKKSITVGCIENFNVKPILLKTTKL